jgi:hypothetical protein
MQSTLHLHVVVVIKVVSLARMNWNGLIAREQHNKVTHIDMPSTHLLRHFCCHVHKHFSSREKVPKIFSFLGADVNLMHVHEITISVLSPSISNAYFIYTLLALTL